MNVAVIVVVSVGNAVASVVGVIDAVDVTGTGFVAVLLGEIVEVIVLNGEGVDVRVGILRGGNNGLLVLVAVGVAVASSDGKTTIDNDNDNTQIIPHRNKSIGIATHLLNFLCFTSGISSVGAGCDPCSICFGEIGIS